VETVRVYYKILILFLMLFFIFSCGDTPKANCEEELIVDEEDCKLSLLYCITSQECDGAIITCLIAEETRKKCKKISPLRPF
jgi:hypothetical protein